MSGTDTAPLLTHTEPDATADPSPSPATVDKGGKLWLSHRFRIFCLLFVGCTLHVMIRSSLNSAFVAMVNYTATDVHHNINQSDRCPDAGVLNMTKEEEDGEFVWNANQQSQLLSALYYGCVILQVPGGYLAERYGGKWLTGVASLLAGVFTLVTPFLARWSFWAAFTGRFVAGLFSGPVYGMFFALCATWVPRYEVTWFVGGMIQGYALGQMLAFAFSGIIIQYNFLGGWPAVFYIYGGALALWSLLWLYLGADSPATDPTISSREREYIEDSTGHRETTEYKNPPLRKLLTSPPILSFWFVMMADQFGFYVLFSSLTIFMKRILGYDIESNGLLLALQYGASIISATVACPLSDWVRSKGLLSTKKVRLITSLFGEFTLAAAMLLIALVYECDRLAVVVLLIVGQFLSGFKSAGFNVAAMDFVPVYSGTVNGVGNWLATLMGFVAPIVVGWITGGTPSRTEWSYVFILTAAIMSFGVIIYALFTTDQELSWARSDSEKVCSKVPDTDIGPCSHSDSESIGHDHVTVDHVTVDHETVDDVTVVPCHAGRLGTHSIN